MIQLGQKLFIWLLCLLFLQASYIPSNDDPRESIVREILQKKESAVQERNLEKFLSAIDHENTFYVQEQKRWFADALKVIEPASYRLELLQFSPKQKDNLRVEVKQSYQQNGKRYILRLPLSFRKTKQGWRESDLDFYQLKSGPIKVLYTTPALEESASIALDTIKRALYVMQQRNKWQANRIEVKLYHDPEVFRQSVKPSLPLWAGGWNEINQSIKLVVDHRYPQWFASGLVHELAHQMVSNLTNDNAAYWLQEGAAMYYEMHLLPGLHEGIAPHENQQGKYTFAELKKLDLEELPSEKASQYYWSCYHLFRFLVNKYGEDKINQIFATLKKFPFHDVDTNVKKELLNRRTGQAIRHVLTVTEKQLEQEWKEQE